MKSNRIEKMTKNLVAKIVCVAIALLVYTFHQNRIISSKKISVPLEVKADGVVLPTSYIQKFVQIKVKTSEASVDLVDEKNITAVLNLDSYTENGMHKVPVSLILSEKLVQDVETKEIKVSPDYLKVKLEKKGSKYIPVAPSITGEPGNGFLLGNCSVEPSTVRAIGPASIIDATQSISTDAVNIAGKQKSGEVSVRLFNENPFVKIEDVAVVVRYEISPVKTSQKYENIEVGIANLSEKFKIEGEIAKVSFNLNGDKNLLSATNISEKNVFVDCSEIKKAGEYELTLNFSVPSGMTVTEKSADKIIINVVPHNKKDAEAETNQ